MLWAARSLAGRSALPGLNDFVDPNGLMAAIQGAGTFFAGQD